MATETVPAPNNIDIKHGAPKRPAMPKRGRYWMPPTNIKQVPGVSKKQLGDHDLY